MIAVLRSELYRMLTIRSSLVSLGLSLVLGVATGWLDVNFWSLFAGLGAFGVAVVTTAQHYQHRTAILLFVGQPRRLRALTAQCVAAVLLATATALISGLSVLGFADQVPQFRATLTVVPLMALYGVANATIVRRPTWLFAGYAGWLIFVEGIIGRLESPLPFSSFLLAASGDPRNLRIFATWTAAALLVAALSIRRDLSD